MARRASPGMRSHSSSGSGSGRTLRCSVISGRMIHPDGRAYWENLGEQIRRELPMRMRDIRWRRVNPGRRSIVDRAGDWVYCPAEFFVATRRAKLAVTSHDVLQTLNSSPPGSGDLLGQNPCPLRPHPVRLAL